MYIALTNTDKIKILKDVLKMMELQYHDKDYDFAICSLIFKSIQSHNFPYQTMLKIQIEFNLLKYNIYYIDLHLGWFSFDKKGAEKRIQIVNELIEHFENT